MRLRLKTQQSPKQQNCIENVSVNCATKTREDNYHNKTDKKIHNVILSTVYPDVTTGTDQTTRLTIFTNRDICAVEIFFCC